MLFYFDKFLTSTLLFNLAIMPLLKALSRENPDLDLNVWYHDDGTIRGPRDTMVKVVDILLKRGPEYGCHLNVEKTAIYSPSADPGVNFDDFPATFKRVKKPLV